MAWFPCPPRRLLSLLALVFLAGCAGTRMDAPVNEDWQRRYDVLEALRSWEFTGRIAVRDDFDSHTARIRWRQSDGHYVINVWGTLNIGATQITGSPEGVRLVQDGEEPLSADSQWLRWRYHGL